MNTQLATKVEILEQFDLNTLDVNINGSITRLGALLQQKNNLLARYRTLQAEAESIEGGLLLSGSIDGKNAETRKAQLHQFLAANPLSAEMEATRGEMDRVDAELEIERLRHGAIKARLAAVTAVIGFLGS